MISRKKRKPSLSNSFKSFILIKKTVFSPNKPVLFKPAWRVGFLLRNGGSVLSMILDEIGVKRISWKHTQRSGHGPISVLKGSQNQPAQQRKLHDPTDPLLITLFPSLYPWKSCWLLFSHLILVPAPHLQPDATLPLLPSCIFPGQASLLVAKSGKALWPHSRRISSRFGHCSLFPGLWDTPPSGSWSFENMTCFSCPWNSAEDFTYVLIGISQHPYEMCVMIVLWQRRK